MYEPETFQGVSRFQVHFLDFLEMIPLKNMGIFLGARNPPNSFGVSRHICTKHNGNIFLKQVLRKALAEKDVDFCMGLLTLDDLPGFRRPVGREENLFGSQQKIMKVVKVREKCVKYLTEKIARRQEFQDSFLQNQLQANICNSNSFFKCFKLFFFFSEFQAWMMLKSWVI